MKYHKTSVKPELEQIRDKLTLLGTHLNVIEQTESLTLDGYHYKNQKAYIDCIIHCMDLIIEITAAILELEMRYDP